MIFQDLLLDGEDHTDRINGFIEHFGMNDVAPDRISGQLAIDLYVGSYLIGDIDIPRVMQEIYSLEGLHNSTTKKPTPFRKPPLKGLWHKHHLAVGIQSLALNILKESERTDYVVSQELIDFLDSDIDRERKAQVCAASFAAAFSQKTFEKRVQRKAMTGEWIIFAKHEGKNYYLCLGQHGEDEAIIQKLKGFPLSEFPFLGETLSLE